MDYVLGNVRNHHLKVHHFDTSFHVKLLSQNLDLLKPPWQTQSHIKEMDTTCNSLKGKRRKTGINTRSYRRKVVLFVCLRLTLKMLLCACYLLAAINKNKFLLLTEANEETDNLQRHCTFLWTSVTAHCNKKGIRKKTR